MIRMLTLLLFVGLAALGQYVAPARAGLIHYAEGAVLLNGARVAPPTRSRTLSLNQYSWVGDAQLLSTGAGRAEVLLGPGAVLWLAKNSSIRLLSNDIADAKVALESGEALIEVFESPRNSKGTIQVAGRDVQWSRTGVYHFSADPARLRVFSGESVIDQLVVKQGQELDLTGEPDLRDFDIAHPGEFHYWAAVRSYELFVDRGRRNPNWKSDGRVFENSRFGVEFRGSLSLHGLIKHRGGVVSSVQGEAFLSPRVAVVRPPFHLEENATVRTERGYAEILIATGITARLDNDSVLRMLDSRPASPAVSIERGSALFEVAKSNKDGRLRIRVGESVTELRKPGLYLIRAQAAALSVYDGEARVSTGQTIRRLRSKQTIELSGGQPPVPAAALERGALFQWSGVRSFTLYLAAADLMTDWARLPEDLLRGTASHKQYGRRTPFVYPSFSASDRPSAPQRRRLGN